jgi:hypothetical protein
MYTRERDVTTPSGTTLADALSAQIEVVVTWTEARGEPQEYRLASVISKF